MSTTAAPLVSLCCGLGPVSCALHTYFLSFCHHHNTQASLILVTYLETGTQVMSCLVLDLNHTELGQNPVAHTCASDSSKIINSFI